MLDQIMATPSTRELLQLDVQTRLKLIDELWDSIVDDLDDPDQPNPLPVSAETRTLLDERIREYRADPAAGLRWEDVQERLLEMV